MSTLELIVAELKKLPPRKLEQAAAFVRELHEKDRSERLAALERSATMLTDEEGAALEQAISEGRAAHLRFEVRSRCRTSKP